MKKNQSSPQSDQLQIRTFLLIIALCMMVEVTHRQWSNFAHNLDQFIHATQYDSTEMNLTHEAKSEVAEEEQKDKEVDFLRPQSPFIGIRHIFQNIKSRLLPMVGNGTVNNQELSSNVGQHYPKSPNPEFRMESIQCDQTIRYNKQNCS